LYTGVCLLPFRNNQLDNEGFIYERGVKIAFSNMARTRKGERALRRMKLKLKKKIN
jgi:hypothetical protein